MSPITHTRDNRESGNAVGFDEAMRDLAETIAGRKVEPIRIAYMALRKAAGKMPPHEILEHVDRAVTTQAGSARQMIYSAFSHGHCVMCSNGIAPCRTCDGSGTVNDYVCPDCDGTGVEICSFCAGTNWSDRHEIPDEIRPAAVSRRIKHAEKDLARLDRMSEADMPASVGKLQTQQRRKLASRLLRLQARLTNLAGVEVGSNTEHVARFHEGASRIERFIEALRAKQPPAEKNQ